MTERHDIVIPLGVKSYENENFEIKVAIGSIRKYCKFTNRIIIVSQITPIKELIDKYKIKSRYYHINKMTEFIRNFFKC